jgi:lipopolysaccharide transport system permease protein
MNSQQIVDSKTVAAGQVNYESPQEFAIASLPVTMIKPARGWTGLGLRELWDYRELLVFLVWRDVQATYRQTALGISWMVLRPLIMTVVLSVVFGGLAQLPSDGVPYPLFSVAALMPWIYFQNAVTRATTSLTANMHIISKVYFPRLLVPTAGVTASLIEFAASFVIFIVLLAFYRMPLRWEMLWLPVFIFLALLSALAMGLWLATLAVKYRDVSFAMGFVLQALMYISPVIYSVSMVPESLRLWYGLNPMTGVIQGFRWALLGSEAPSLAGLVLTFTIVIVAMIGGAFVFQRTERSIVDLL